MASKQSDPVHISECHDMPCFVEPICADDPEWVNALDGWSVVYSTGDQQSNWALGESYADLAVVYARTKDSSSFVAFVLASILHKSRQGLLTGDGAIEAGFYDRIARLACAGALN